MLEKQVSALGDRAIGNAAYCLSKGGIRMLTRTAGVELTPHNILVAGVGARAVATPINLSTMNDPVLLKKLNSAIPLGRMARSLPTSETGASDIAAATVLLYNSSPPRGDPHGR